MAVSPVDENLVLFGAPNNGLLRSEDGGRTWHTISSVPASIEIQTATGKGNPGIILWFERAANAEYTGRIWAMSPGHGMYVSSDGGHTFSLLTQPDQLQPKILKRGVFAPNGAFYAVDMEGRAVWKFVDGGWIDLTERVGSPARRYAAVAANPRNSQVFVFDEGGATYRSSDGGLKWTRLLHSSRVGRGDPPWLRVSNQSFFAIGGVQFDPVVPNRLLGGTGTGVYYADVPESALGLVWTSQARGIEELVANDVIHPPGQAPLFAAWDFGVHVKPNLGIFSETYGPKERVVIAAQQLDWSPSSPSFIVTNASDTRMFCCSEDGDSVLAGYSLDGGRNWSKFMSLPQPPGTLRDDPWRMSFGTIAVSANDIDNIVWAPSFNRSPFFTKDRGSSWERVVLAGEKLPFTGSHAEIFFHRKTLAADRVEPSVFYLYHSGEGTNPSLIGLWRSRDGGANWQQVFKGEISPQSRFSAKLRVVPSQAGHLFFTSGVAMAEDTWLRRSTDGGLSWSVVPGVDRVDDIGFGQPTVGATYPAIFFSGRFSGTYGIWRSTNNAKTWTRIGQFPVGTLDQVVVVEGAKDVSGRVYLGYKGSGWVYGEPDDCNPAPYLFPDEAECVRAQ
ncbi:exo-alpha-sialidase [Microvirga aerilata]|uniref:Exo-alpha-sialidase n=1 Tax=Microvirga aerilata TaxID=670292 RepID=A0A936ZHA8_9HYPH|nr:sialidase family protein [Microvirga aerilata]MBL0407187.1 exo-alpha-sialidase [Microvirga aerilata]